MTRAWLQCDGCGYRSDWAMRRDGCPDCRGPFEVKYAAPDPARFPDPGGVGVWAWGELLPPVPAAERVTLGEGGTPLLPVGGTDLLLKNESVNPTWSWKDRAAAVSVSAARHLGFRRVAAVSTGNHGNAVAAYAAVAGLGCDIFCNPLAPPLQTRLMAGYGARVVRGGDQEAQMRELLAGGGVYPCTTLPSRPGYSNPFGVEGFKTIAFEVWHQLGRRLPDAVFVGVGSGDGVYGVWKGFRELRDFGLADRAPRMIACQAAGADSLHRAFRAGENTVRPVADPRTVALSVCEAATGDHALRAVAESGGDVVTATDDEILTAAVTLARRGLALEPASALPFGCAARLRAAGGAGVWVVIGSGAAVKWPDTLPGGGT